jgi:site-specific DNA recombinase
MASKRPEVTHPRTVPSSYLLSGIMFCGCGSAMMGHSAKSKRNFYYLCSRQYKQGKEACAARMVPKEKLEKRIVDELRSRVLTDDNIAELVLLTNEETRSAHSGLKEGLDLVEAEAKDTQARLARVYDAIETGKIELDDLAPRIKALQARIAELEKQRSRLGAEMANRGIENLNLAEVQRYARDLRQLLVESDISDRKAFLKTFVKRTEIDGNSATMRYKLPMGPRANGKDHASVLPIDTFGGAGGIRTPYLCDAKVRPPTLANLDRPKKPYLP